ncbi:MAG: adenosyl-hopene transferase HpnH [Thermoleophilia bacterium]
MPVSLRQQARVGTYLLKCKVQRRDKYPLIVELEPLFACNLACSGCGKIQYPSDIQRQRMSVETAVNAMEECGTPMVAIAGGEPLLHPEIGRMTAALVRRHKYVYLCSNGLLMKSKLDLFTPSPYFEWAVHIDGLRDRHDKSVNRQGVFDTAVDAIKAAKAAGFRVTTNTTIYADDSVETVREVLDYLNDDLRVDAMMISPAYSYEKAPEQHFLIRDQTRALFRGAFADGRRQHWRLNQSPLFLDFLEGKVEYECTPWGIPSYSVLGWQRPCYLWADGYCSTFEELVRTTDWSQYGRASGNPKCQDCMAHCGHEPTAVLATASSLRQGIRALAQI